MARRICVITGSRAEYGLLYWVLHDLRAHAALELQLIATGMHLSHEFGHTVSAIENDGFAIDRRVDMLVSSDTQAATAKSIGLGVIGMSDALQQLRPDIVLVLGDRFEILAAVQACLVHNIPVAHIGGGDTTEGAFDESMRHAITKMAHVHFTTNELSARRVRQMGEDPAHVHVVGSPGLDHLTRQSLLERRALEGELGAALGRRNVLITFHPVTLEPGAGVAQFQELLAALESLEGDTTLWFTRPNADPGGRAIASILDRWLEAQAPGRAHVFASLGQLRYLSLMAQVDVVVGNSSSGLYEAPSFRVPTVNVGARQRGRLAAPSVIDSVAERQAIAAAIVRATALDCSQVVNPYGDGKSAGRIVEILAALADPSSLLKKRFHLAEIGHG